MCKKYKMYNLTSYYVRQVSFGYDMKGEEGGEFITGAWLDFYQITEERSSLSCFGKQRSSRTQDL